MLLTPEQYDQLTAPPASRQAGALAIWPGQRQFYWEWGVIPYEIAPNFSDGRAAAHSSRRCDVWQRMAPVMFVPRTTQTGFLAVTRDELTGSATASPCFAQLSAIRLGRMTRLNLGATCSAAPAARSCTSSGTCSGFTTSISDRTATTTSPSTSATWPGMRGSLSTGYTLPVVGPVRLRLDHALRCRLFRARSCRGRRSFPNRSIRAKRRRWAAAPAPSENDHNMMALLYISQMARERHSNADRSDAHAIRSRRHAAGDGATARLLHEPHGSAAAAGPVDRRPARFPRHRAVDLRYLPAGAVGGLQHQRRVRHCRRGDHAHR